MPLDDPVARLLDQLSGQLNHDKPESFAKEFHRPAQDRSETLTFFGLENVGRTLASAIAIEKNPGKMNKALPTLLILVLSAASLMAQTGAAASPSDACGRFVQQFYEGYLARGNELTKGQSKESALEVTLRERQSSFSPGLVKALQEDLAASKKSPDEIVGLDFDPFLNAQDTPERYVVGEVRPKENHFWVEVFGIWEGKKKSKPDVVPELALENGRWVFINFHYGKSDIPVNENLVTVLQALKKDREKPVK